MRAIQYLGKEQVAFAPFPEPEPGPGEVRLRMRYAGLNRRDWAIVRGDFAIAPPYVLLSDGVGQVEAVGPGVEEGWLGRDVLINPSIPCGDCPACRRGDDPACPAYRIFDGAGAELAVLPVRNVVPKPPELSDVEAAVIGLVFITAYDMVVERARVRPAERVLVWGANGGLGLATLQMVQLVGGEAVAVGRPQEALQRFGALAVVDRRQPGFLAELESLGPFDVVIDSVGQATFADSLRLLRRGGRLVTVGVTSGMEVTIRLPQLFRRRIAVLGAFMGARAILPELLPLFAHGRLKAPPVTVLPAEEAEEAFRRLAQGGFLGKIVLSLDGSS